MEVLYVLVSDGKGIGIYDSHEDAEISASFKCIDDYEVWEIPYYGEWQHDCGIFV